MISTSFVIAPTNEIWWSLLHYYLFLGFAAATIVLSWMTYNVEHNRKRNGAEKKQHAFQKHEGEWGNWKGVLLILLITGSVLAFVEYETFASTGLITSPKNGDPIQIGVIGRQWDWIFVYPNGIQVVGNLTVPEGVNIILNVTSIDVVHSFAIPALSVAKDAVPGHYNTLWFNATQLGSYEIICKEFCGIGHALMTATLYVVPPASYNQWYASLNTASPNIVVTISSAKNDTTAATFQVSTSQVGE